MAGEQEDRSPLLVLPPSCRPLDLALAARFCSDEVRSDGLPLLLRIDAVEPVELVAARVEEDEGGPDLDQEVGVLPLGPSGPPDVPTSVRADELALFDLAPVLIAEVHAHTAILEHATAAYPEPPRLSWVGTACLEPRRRRHLCRVVVLRIAWAIADLAGRTLPGSDEITEALGMRLQRRAAA